MKSTVAALFLAAAALATPLQAQESYPSRPITLIVPVPPGGAADFIARSVGQKLSEALHQPVVVSNRGGASGTIAADNTAKAAPDGYTLLLNSITTHGIGPSLYAKLPYDAEKDFAPIVLIASLPLILVVNSDLSFKTAEELMTFTKKFPGQLTFASSGNGGAPHLAGELFGTITGGRMLHVPYRGSGPAVIDVAAGRVDAMFDAMPSLQPMIQAGKLRPLAAASTRRNPLLPNVPTFAELGVKGMEVSLWYGIVGPAALPQPIVQRLNAELNTILQAPDIVDAFAKQGAVVAGGSPQDYQAFMRAEAARWRELVRRNNIKVE